MNQRKIVRARGYAEQPLNNSGHSAYNHLFIGFSVLLALLVLFTSAGCRKKEGPGSKLEKDLVRLDAQELSEIHLKAEQGSAAAQFSLGENHALGRGLPIHFAEAAKWFRRGAEQGYAP